MKYLTEDVSKRANLTWFYPRICAYQDKIESDKEYFEFLDSELDNREVLLYLHIPFCESFCAYCACFKELLHNYSYEDKKEFVNMMIKEIELYATKPYFKGKKLNHIQFGGGTPSCLDNEFLEMIFEAIYKNFVLDAQCVISFEGNVMTLKDISKLKALKSVGVNRLSFGLQTFDEEIRKSLGIQAKVSEIYEATDNIKKVGFDSFAVDLMYNLPNESIQILDNDLNKIIKEIEPNYIQTYRFNQFYNTVLQKKIERGYFQDPPSNEKELQMFEYIMDKLYQNKYDKHVLINLFSKDKSPISTGLEYTMGNNKKKSSVVLGIGPGASSFLASRNYRSVCSIKSYINRIKNNQYPIEAGNISSSSVMTSRLMVYFPNFTYVYKSEMEDYQQFEDRINFLIENDYVYESQNRIILTKKGKLWAGDIGNMFYAEEEIKKFQKSMYYSIKNNSNSFNQDNMNMSKESKILGGKSINGEGK